MKIALTKAFAAAVITAACPYANDCSLSWTYSRHEEPDVIASVTGHGIREDSGENILAEKEEMKAARIMLEKQVLEV